MRIRSLDCEEILKTLGEGFGTSTRISLSIYFSWKKFSIMSNRFTLRPDVYDLWQGYTCFFVLLKF